MKYRIDARYCWYNKKTQIVLMYFIQNIPFTFDELPEYASDDPEIIDLANCEIEYDPEDLYKYSFYLIDEQFHPLLFELDLENPEILPSE